MKNFLNCLLINYYLLFKNASLDSLIISFNESSASDVNWFVELTISTYNFFVVDKNVIIKYAKLFKPRLEAL